MAGNDGKTAGTDVVDYYNKSNKSGTQLNKFGHLRRFLIKEHGSKISNILEVKSGEKIKKLKGLRKLVRELKYKAAEFGTVALVKEDETYYIGEVLDQEDYGTDTLYYLKVAYKKISANNKTYLVTKEYKLDPRAKDKNAFIVKTDAFNESGNQEVSLTEINGIIGKAIFKQYETLDTGYIPARVFTWDNDGNGPLFEMDEIFLLERQLLKEIKRDLDLSRKKVLYKTRLARKTASALEVEMNEKSLVVFEDGNAIFSSPIDLWSPALATQTITNAIDWLMSYALKVTFAAKDSMATGAQKGDKQISEINQAPQNVLEDILESWSENFSEFFTMVLDEETEIEVHAMTTPENLINGAVDSKTVVKQGSEGDK